MSGKLSDWKKYTVTFKTSFRLLNGRDSAFFLKLQ